MMKVDVHVPTHPVLIPFAGNDYFCETGVPPGQSWWNTFYADDPLRMVKVVVQLACTVHSSAIVFIWFCICCRHSNRIDRDIYHGMALITVHKLLGTW